MSEQSITVFDADGMIAGRLAAKMAKAALMGNHVVVVNVEKAIITGDRRTVIDAYKTKREIRNSANPTKGPFHEKRPDRMFRRMVRGMLPWSTPRARAAYKRVRVFIGVPGEFAGNEKTVLEDSRYRSPRRKHVTMGDLSHELGWTGLEVA